MKNKLLTFAGALALLVVLGHFYAKPLLAQVRAALVQSIDEPGRSPFQQEVQTGLDPSLCSLNGLCSAIFTFAKVPANKRLVIKNVAAYFTMSSGATVPFAAIISDFTSMYFPVARQTTSLVVGAFCTVSVPCDTWVANQPVALYTEPNSTPVVVVSVDKNHLTPIFMSAAISGYYVSLP